MNCVRRCAFRPAQHSCLPRACDYFGRSVAFLLQPNAVGASWCHDVCSSRWRPTRAAAESSTAPHDCPASIFLAVAGALAAIPAMASHGSNTHKNGEGQSPESRSMLSFTCILSLHCYHHVCLRYHFAAVSILVSTKLRLAFVATVSGRGEGAKLSFTCVLVLH